MDLEPVFFDKPLLDRQEYIFFAGYDSAAFFTPEVMVMPFFGMMVYGMPVEFAFKDAVVGFQHFQCPVNRRFVDVRIPLMDEADDFFGRNMSAAVMNEIQYHPAGAGDSHSLLL
jgi:hypothetical protein